MKDLNTLVDAHLARKMILDMARNCGSERVSLKHASYRILSEDLASLRTQPPFDASAMDGYALSSSSIDANNGTLPVELTEIGESAAGHPFIGKVEAGEIVRIFTGAPVPQGADIIAIQENAERLENGLIRILKIPEKGKFIRKAGLDFATGEVLLKAGSRLDPVSLSLAASMNHGDVPLFVRPKVSILATGDELVPPGETVGEGQIIASNSFGVSALCEKLGAQVKDQGIAKDTQQALVAAGQAALEDGADLIVTMGGASVGDHDLIMPAFTSLGFEFHLAKIAMRPGKPFLFATKQHNGKTVYLTGLAGNPVSSMVASMVFVKPLVEALCGAKPEEISASNGILGCDLPENDEREEYMRAELQTIDGKVVVTPFSRQDSSMLATLSRANCLMIRPAKAKPSSAGDPCKFIPLS